MFKRSRGIALYHQLETELIDLINSGELKENDKLPSERELCEQYNVSRTTARQAIGELERKEYVYKVHGKGTFISPKVYKQQLLKFYSFTEEMKKLGKNDPDEMHRERQLSRLSMQAMRQITTLKMAGIPSEYWNIDAMNWVLVRWGQKQDTDFRSMFKRYDIYVEKHYSVSEKKKIHAYKRQFHHNLKKLLSYALEA